METGDPPATGIPRSAPTPPTFVADRTPVRRLEFVEVGMVVARPSRKPVESAVEADADARPERATMPDPGLPETRWSLWADLEG